MSNSINTTNNLTSTSIPELYIRYFNPKININTDIIIPYYVSDNTQEEFLKNTNTKTFTTIVKIGNNTFSQTTNAGEYSINIGSISTTGETYFSIYTIDENGVASVEQFFDILIIDSSYTITSSQTYTMVESDLTKHNIVVGESVSNTVAQSNNTGLNNLFNEVKNNGYRKIIMLNRIYMLDYHGDKIMPPSEFTVDMNNATFKATQCTDINVANLVDLKDCFDTHVINGKLVGNYDGFDFATTQSTTGYYIPGEGLAVAEMNGAKYSSFENMDMSYSVGYNLGVFGGKDAGYIGSPGSLKFSNAYYINGNNTVNSDILSTTDLIDITGLLDRGEIQCSVYLNYGGLKLNKAELFIHFYNSSSNYMTTIKTRQYQMVKIPNGATKVRVTGFTASSTDNSGLSICHTGYSKNCELINIKSHNTRTCAMHPGIYNHLLIKNCTFNRVADENEYKVTKLALDFEDGYENGRNLFFINNEVYEGTSALTIQRCFNANIIGCRNFGLDTRGHIKGAYIKNNFFNNGDIYTTNFDSQSHLKLINNTFFKTLNFLKWDDTGNYDSIGLTELDCKNGYTNNKNCTLFIRNESSGSGDSGDSGGIDTPSSYTITNNLTNCTTNNNNESVSSNSNYTATITANNGYVMASIVVTMGGADISDTAVSGNNINISNVTGNIVITAVASEQAEVLPNITLFDNGLAEGYTISNGANYTVGDKITLNHSSNTYFGFDQSVTFNAGDTISFVIDTCGSNASEYITRVCWLDDNNALQGYETAVTDDVVSANLPYTLTHTFNSTTTIKPALMKYFGNITINKVYITTTEVVIGEQPLYKFGLLSDTHVDGDGTDTAHSISDLTNAISFSESAGANFIAYTGDMTYNGRTEDYTALKTCLETSTIPNYCVRGNHDAYSLSDGYASATGCEDDYIITQGNDLLIFISCADTNHDTGGLTTSKLDWLENLLQTNTNTRVFLFYHYFVDGTSGNGTGVYPYGTLNPSNAIALRFINMVKQYPNLIYCNGHSHMRFNIQDQDANANYYHNDGECYYIHVPSTAKPRFPSGDTVADYYEGSEGYLVEVYANKVIFKPIDFIASEYLTKYNYTANVSQGNNAPTVPSVPDTPSTIDITWNNGVKIDRSTGAETSDTNYSASNFIACDSSKTYTLNLASAMPVTGANVFACYYDESQSFISCSDNFIGSYHGSSEVFTAELSIPTNAKYIKLRLYASADASAMDKSIITLTTTTTTTSEVITPTWMNGGISNSSGENISDAYGMRSSYMEFDTNAYTYYITVTDEFEGINKLRVAIYNPDGSFVVRQSYTSTSLTPGVPGAIEFPVTSGKFRLKVDFMTSNTLENINNRLVITRVAKEQAEVLPNITLFDNGLVEGYTISNGANYEVSNVITLNHGSNTYFGFDQSITFNSGDSINFIINTCSHDTAGYNTRVCYLTDSNKLQGYETTVTDDIVSANLPYKLTHTFNSKVTIKPALMKYFGNITVSKVYVTRAGSIDDTTYYTITNNLTNCTTNNNSATVSSDSSYSAIITANDGYTLTTLTVSMGGIDYTNRPNVITDTEWNGKPAKQITIENVNGNIVITANATQTSGGTESGELTYTSAVTGDFTTVGDCDGISIDSSNNLVASTLDKFGMVKLNKPVRKLQFNVRDNQADHGALCWYIYNTYKDGAMDKYNMIALSNVADGENGKLFKMAIPGVYKQEIDKLDIPAINPGEQLTIEITDSAPTTKQYKDERTNDTVMTTEIITTHTIKRADGTILATLTGNMSAWCGQSTNSSPFCSNIKYVPEVVYDNPTYSVEDCKIILSQDGYSEVFDANNHIYDVYCENSKDFVWEGENYALALFRGSTGSKFRINGMCPSAFGYRVLNKENSTEPYDLLDDAYVPTVNNFNFSVGFRNGDLEHQHQVDASLLEDCISTFNCALPAFNYSVDSNSRNSVVVDEYNETWYGLSMTVDDHYEIKINQTNLINDYGTLHSSTENYRAWKSTLVHELGHSLGFDDNSAHFPTLYTYRRTRPEVYYLQAPDIYTLKSLYKEKYNIDISKSQEDINSQVVALGLGTHASTDKPSGRILSVHFDYPAYTNNELYDKSDLIIEGKLEFDRCENINIGSENSPLILEYNVYKIIPNSVIKGEITNYELKIHVSEKIDIGTNNTYKLYLKQFENTPCSLVNIKQGIIDL